MKQRMSAWLERHGIADDNSMTLSASCEKPAGSLWQSARSNVRPRMRIEAGAAKPCCSEAVRRKSCCAEPSLPDMRVNVMETEPPRKISAVWPSLMFLLTIASMRVSMGTCKFSLRRRWIVLGDLLTTEREPGRLVCCVRSYILGVCD